MGLYRMNTTSFLIVDFRLIWRGEIVYLFIPNIRNNVGFGKEAAQIFCLERVTIASMARHE